jgi:hypothetical protein
MSLSFLDLQNKVLGWLDSGTATTADADELAIVKEALVEADVERTLEHRWPFMVAEPALTFTLVPGTRTYTLDASFHIPIYFWNTSKKAPLTQFPEEDVPSRDYQGGLVDDYYTSSPQYGAFLLRGNKITLLWTPVEADVIEYQFYKLATEMVNDADLPNTPYPHSRVLIYDALLRIGAHQEDLSPTKMTLWEKKQEEHAAALLEAHGQENNQWTVPPRVNYVPRD